MIRPAAPSSPLAHPEHPALAGGPVYLDYNATTPVDPRVTDALLPYLTRHFGNPSSSHAYGRCPRTALERARGQVAALIGAEPHHLVFTGSGSEADSLVIRGATLAALHERPDRWNTHRPHVITQATEHPAVLRACEALQRLHGIRVTYLMYAPKGIAALYLRDSVQLEIPRPRRRPRTRPADRNRERRPRRRAWRRRRRRRRGAGLQYAVPHHRPPRPTPPRRGRGSARTGPPQRPPRPPPPPHPEHQHRRHRRRPAAPRPPRTRGVHRIGLPYRDYRPLPGPDRHGPRPRASPVRHPALPRPMDHRPGHRPRHRPHHTRRHPGFCRVSRGQDWPVSEVKAATTVCSPSR